MLVEHCNVLTQEHFNVLFRKLIFTSRIKQGLNKTGFVRSEVVLARMFLKSFTE